MHDACTISLSDHLTPWSVIEKRIEAAAAADFVIALYNPKSGRRTRQIAETQRILLEHRAPDTPVGLVKSAYRDRQHVVRTTLADMLNHDIGMLTTVVIGNSSTFYHGDLMITPRGYQRKYTLNTSEQRLRPGERLQPENEPWSLNAAVGSAGTAKSLTTRRFMSPNYPLQPEQSVTARQYAADALSKLSRRNAAPATFSMPVAAPNSSIPSSERKVQSIFEVAVSPGVANKKFTPAQLICLANLAGEAGELEYTTAHHLILRTKTDQPDAIVSTLQHEGFMVLPVGEVVKVKACDFCDGEKHEGIPFAEAISNQLAGLSVEKELRIGFNGCAMACYGAVNEDIGLVFRKGKFDVFLGGKTTGRNASPGQRVAEGLPAESVPELLERIVQTYRRDSFPGERFHKFFARVGQVEGFVHKDKPQPVAADSICGT